MSDWDKLFEWAEYPESTNASKVFSTNRTIQNRSIGAMQ